MKKVSYIILWVITFLFGCTSKEKTCDVKELILEESFFPGEVLSEPLDSPIPDGPDESVEKIFYIITDQSTDVIQQDVMNFGFANLASDFFQDGEKQVFKTDANRGEWAVPKELMTFSLEADQSHLACGIVLSSKTCRWLARYGSYYVYLRADISDNGMTASIFADAVKEIDTRMLQCVGE